jgi:O-antigen/teichoic acid export membrane protein
MDPAAPAAPAVTASPPAQDPRKLVLKNTMILMLGQILGMPLSTLVTVAMGRLLGAASYGDIYVAGTRTGLGFLLVEWGQGPVMSGGIARDRSKAGLLLGTTLVWRLSTALLVYGVLFVWALAERSSQDFHMILALLTLQSLITTMIAASVDAVRGLERTDVSAYQNVLQPVLGLAIVVPVLAIFRRNVRAALLAQAAVLLLVLAYVWWARRRVGIKPLRFGMATLKAYFGPGSAFLVFGLAMVLQPVIDANYLHAMVPAEVVGWNAAAKKLIGPLLMPSSVLVGALFPTLSRLHIEDRAEFVKTVRSALRGTMILTFPLALCCALYGDIGVWLYGKQEYGGALPQLVLLAPYLFLMYFSMPLGTSILAAQRQKAWTAVQFICVAVSAILDPILIPIFQRRYGDGARAVCVAAVVSEVFVVACGVWLAEKGTFDRGFVLNLLRAMAAAAAMAATGLLLRWLSLPSLANAPVALAVYFGVLWAIGGLRGEQLGALRDTIRRKLRR